MHRTCIALTTAALAFAGLTFTAAAPAQAQSGDQLRQDLEFARRKVYPALVNIGVVSKQYSGGRIRRGASAGSGVIVSPGGVVLTNYHVAGQGERLSCTLPSGEIIDAEVIAHDPAIDISVIRLKMDKRASKEPLPFATLGDSSKLRVGDHVLAMGNPLSLSSSMTLGIISNTARVFTDFTGTEISELNIGGEATGMFTRWLQTDALILPGNSGGPLVNLKGEVIGINTRGGNGVGFASPSNLVSKSLHQALAYGEIRRGWLGCAVLPVGKLGRKSGALISHVIPDSPAAQAGLKAGDILVRVGEEKVDARFFEQIPLLYQSIAELEIGSSAELHYERNGELHVGKATVVKMERYTGDEDVFRHMGITATEITGPMALARRYPHTNGVVITGIRAGQPFEEARPSIQSGDVILKIGDHDITDLASFREALKAVQELDTFMVHYRRGQEDLITVVEKPEEKPKSRGGELAKAWLGVRTQVCTTKVAEALGKKDLRGFRVTLVYPETEAAKAGLQPGDVITAVDEEAMDAYRPQDAQDLRRAIEDYPIGEAAELAIWRAGKALTLKVTLQETPRPTGEATTARDKELEFSVRELVFEDRVRLRWSEERTGVVVTEVTGGGFAGMAGLHGGDVLARINTTDVTDIESFKAAVEALHKAKPAVVQLFVHRGFRTHFVVIEPDWEQLDKTK